MWVELLAALIVEGYRELLEWWQTRSFLRPLRREYPADEVAEGTSENEADRAELVAETVGWILDRHARKHVGVAVGVLWGGKHVDIPARPSPRLRLGASRRRRQRFADGHNRRGRSVPHWHFDALAGAGGLRSSVGDLLRFLELQHAEPTVRVARAARETHWPRATRGRLEQGLGWASLPLRGDPRRMLWHNGGTGGFRSFVGFVRDAGIAVVVLSNSARSVDAIGFRLLESLSRAAQPATRA